LIVLENLIVSQKEKSREKKKENKQ